MTEMPPYLAANDEEKSSEQTDSDSSDYEDDLPITFNQPRHTEPIIGPEREEHTWRAKEKYKTHCVALVLCLNVGVDPPDVIKTQPSKLIITNQGFGDHWTCIAITVREMAAPCSLQTIKKLCCSLRRNAKEERVLFHYNGHGVPKPTAQGEIWVFNRAYTQYIPLSMFDLQTWMGAPSLYVYDCSNAGTIINMFHMFAKQHYREYEKDLKAKGRDAVGPPVSYKNCIQLGACAAGQSLPMSPELPADLFTACLTTPVKMAMKWFVLRSRPRATRADLIDLIDNSTGSSRRSRTRSPGPPCPRRPSSSCSVRTCSRPA
ncbi:unnamed protein product [Leptidea sinapis]|uniref:Raptor N-terminal CASPase-like domain-containing protein n=1 Tax=Leptidea sinapis TaxID=189913 RepID=A0A5E4QB54_9NEOP|nr:unnamed protein product [Leptidea sinapis]